jgi:hypothetical protein
MDLPARAAISPKNRGFGGPEAGVSELSTKTVDNYVDFFSSLAPCNGLVRLWSLCRNIEQSSYSFIFNNLIKRLQVNRFGKYIFGKRQNSVHKSSSALCL